MALGAAPYCYPILDLMLLIMLPLSTGLIAVFIAKLVHRRSAADLVLGRRAKFALPRSRWAQVAELERLFQLEGDDHPSIHTAAARGIFSDSGKEPAKRRHKIR